MEIRSNQITYNLTYSVIVNQKANNKQSARRSTNVSRLSAFISVRKKGLSEFQNRTVWVINDCSTVTNDDTDCEETGKNLIVIEGRFKLVLCPVLLFSYEMNNRCRSDFLTD